MFPSKERLTSLGGVWMPLLLLVTACGGGNEDRPSASALSPLPATGSAGARLTEETMKQKVAQFKAHHIGVEASAIPEGHRTCLKFIIEAARIIDDLYLCQVSKDNPATRAAIAAAGLEQSLAYFDIMYGPWDRLDRDRPFYGDKTKPVGVTFYPEDLTQAEFSRWITTHPEDKADFESYFTVIERRGTDLITIPYSEAYKAPLAQAARLLNQAAASATDERLAAFLSARAEAFSSNRYRASDMAWMDLGDGDLEVVIGPYEVYEDGLMGLKASFEAFVALRNAEASRQLAAIQAIIPEMEAFLPIPDAHKNPHRGTESPISVVDLLYAAGDARAGVQTLAFNLPNDEVVREQKGSKKVMLRNVAHAKFDEILMPIAERLVRKNQQSSITFDAFFHHTLVHETAHGLGPGRITVKDASGAEVQTTVNQALREYYSVIEEAKADVLGMYLNYLLIEKGERPAAFEASMAASALGGFFRSVRFGADEAHGQANLVQLNFLLEKGAVVKDPDGRYGFELTKMRSALESLAQAILMIEARGDIDAARRFIETYGAMPADLRDALAGIQDIPTDIRPVYPIENHMAGW